MNIKIISHERDKEGAPVSRLIYEGETDKRYSETEAEFRSFAYKNLDRMPSASIEKARFQKSGHVNGGAWVNTSSLNIPHMVADERVYYRISYFI